MYLLDTNVVSETRRAARADLRAMSWLNRLEPEEWWVSVVTDYELELGVLGMRHRDPHQASLLAEWLENARASYEPRMLPIGHEIGRICARIQVPNRRPLTDALIAATALHHGLTVVTRNARDFDIPGLRVTDPFSA